MTHKLVIRQQFDLAVSLEMGQAFRWHRVGDEAVRNGDWGQPPPFWQTGGGGWYSGVLKECLVHVRQVDDGVEYRVGGPNGEREDVDLTEALSRYFRLDDPIDLIHSALRQNPVAADAIEQCPGIRLLRQDRWECLVSYLCSSTNNIPGIQQCVEKIAGLSRRTARLDGEERRVFPDAYELAAAGRSWLDDLQLGLNRADNILSSAKEIDQDPYVLDRLAGDEVAGVDAVRELDRRDGIGPKIASCVALMSLDKLDAFPVDRWIQRALSQCDLSSMPRGRRNLAERVTGLGRLTDRQQYPVAKWAGNHFGAYASYAGQYLFHWIEPVKRVAHRADGRPGHGA